MNDFFIEQFEECKEVQQIVQSSHVHSPVHGLPPNNTSFRYGTYIPTDGLVWAWYLKPLICFLVCFCASLWLFVGA